jgi:hypothetical protein
MKQFMIMSSLAISCVFLPGIGMGGFLDDLLKAPPPEKEQALPAQGESNEKPSTEEAPDAIQGLGEAFGIKKKKIDLFKKGLGGS